MDWKLELIGLPVSDIDRAKAFYVDQVGFVADHDHTVSDEIRFVQVTPPGSACSVAFGRGISNAEPGSVDVLQLVVDDVEHARAELVARASRSPTSRSSLGVRSSTSATPTAMRGRSSRSHRDELTRVRAVVYDRYGPPDVLRVDERCGAVLRPTGRCGSRSPQRRSTSATGSACGDHPCTRASAGCARRLAARSVRTSPDGSTPSARGVTRFQPGDEVYGDNLALKGGFAEYTLAAESALVHKPARADVRRGVDDPSGGCDRTAGHRRRGGRTVAC